MRFPIERMNSSSKGEEIADLMRFEIISGSLKPGSTVSENSIASQYQSSRSPSREAMRILQNEGLITLKRLGAEVIGLSQKDIEELNDIRFMLERFAMIECAKKKDNSLIAFLEFTVEKMKIAIDQKNAEELSFLDIAFHEAIIKASEHNRIIHIWKSIEKLIITALLMATEKRFSSDEQGYQEFLVQKHLEIVEAILEEDAGLIEHHLKTHFIDTRKTVSESVFTNNGVVKKEK
ncbi:GntR family transcriptional regulator [Alteribacillus sp. HJP-4]|uniref:GntR family transcriptional regulator n=1 Tax=Alteribacillus sp. HJP-4 TaxID=2775394 RepID=UPI0035CD037E